MNFAFSEEQEELRKVVKQFMEDKSPEAAVRELMASDTGYDPDVWKQMGEQMGLQGLIFPEAMGGSEFSYIELVVVLEEMGRALLCAPYFSSVVLAGNTLQHLPEGGDRDELLSRIATGEAIATLAYVEEGGRWDLDGIQMEAKKSGDGEYELTGTKMYVPDGTVADIILVLAKTESGVSVLWCEGDAKGLERTSLSTLDQTRKQARLEFSKTPAKLVGNEGSASEIFSLVMDLAAVALAAEQVGGAQMCLDMSVEYSKERIQFGRPIGSFQAIKHKCADMLLEVESAKSAAYYASWCASELNDELPSVAALAKSYCSEAYFHAAAENIQIHGGIGFTWEHPAHLYFKRAKSSELMFGDPTYHRELLAQRIGL